MELFLKDISEPGEREASIHLGKSGNPFKVELPLQLVREATYSEPVQKHGI